MSLTSHLYTVELTANVRKPWMNYVHNELKQIFDLVLELLFVMNIQIFDIYILLLATPKKIVLGDKNDFCNYILALFCHIIK